MKQPIIRHHTDEQGYWVAQLACGHNQHVRHDPRWMVCERVIEEEIERRMKEMH